MSKSLREALLEAEQVNGDWLLINGGGVVIKSSGGCISGC